MVSTDPGDTDIPVHQDERKSTPSHIIFANSTPYLTFILDGREVEGHPLDQIHTLNEQDAQDQYALEGMDYGDGVLSGIRSRTRSNTDHIVINWEIDDPDNPHNWSTVNTTSKSTNNPSTTN